MLTYPEGISIKSPLNPIKSPLNHHSFPIFPKNGENLGPSGHPTIGPSGIAWDYPITHPVERSPSRPIAFPGGQG